MEHVLVACLGPAEIASFVCLILFKDGGQKVGAQDESKISSFCF